MKKKTPCKQVEGLKAYAAERHGKTEEKISRAIEQMKKEGGKITFSSVAGRAGVSRTTLYGNEQIRERIQGLMALSADNGKDEGEVLPAGRTGLTDRIKALREQVKKLESDKAKLVIQLAGHYELKKENERLRRQLEKGHGREKPMPEEGC